MMNATRTVSTAAAEEVEKSVRLPDTPLITIKASGSWVALNLRDLWSYRELLYFLAWRDVKLRYRQTLLGVVWAFFQPLFLTLLFTFIFGRLARILPEDIPSPLFFYSGLVLWVFFATNVLDSANSLIENRKLITKVYFPRMLVPSSAVVSGLI